MKKLIMFFSIMMLVSISQAKEFSDLPNDHWSYEYVQTLSDKGIINGYDDGTFKPNQAVTRAEFATIFIKSTNNESVSETPKTFEDVNESHWFYPYVEKSSDYIFTWGNKFYPNDSMKREEVAYAIVKSNGLDEKKTNLNILDRFNDKDSITEFFKPYVAMAVENGYMSGKGEGFDPQNGLTRAEICALFSKNQNSKNDVKLSEIIRLGIFGSDVKSDEKITRAEMSKIICQLAGISEYMVEPYENSVEYKDVKKGSEYIGWIYTSLRDDYFVLYDDDTFRPNEKMENIHGIILLEKVLGRTDYILKGSYPDNFIQDAKSIGMIEQDIDYEEILTYGTLANMIYNVLDIGIWEGNNNMIELIPDMSIRKNVHAISEENAFQYSMYKECDEVPDFGALLGYTLDKMDYTSGGLIYTYKVHSPKQDDLEQYAKILEDIKFEETAKTEQVTLFEKGNWTVMYTMNDSEYRIGILEKRNDDVGLKLSDDELNMKVGDKAKIEIDLESDLGMDLTLDVDNEILEIEWDEWEDFSTALIIKAVKDGKCIITVGIKGTDIKETVEVVVEPDIKTTLKAAKSKLNLEVGEDTKVNITATTHNGINVIVISFILSKNACFAESVFILFK